MYVNAYVDSRQLSRFRKNSHSDGQYVFLYTDWNGFTAEVKTMLKIQICVDRVIGLFSAL